MTCKTKVCPECARTKAESVEEWTGRAFDSLRGPEGAERYFWQLLVVTTKYDPCDHEDVDWPALRERALLLTRASKKVWKECLGVPPEAGMYRTIEVSVRGAVHMNLLYFGPKVDQGDFNRVLMKIDPRMGHMHWQAITHDPSMECDRKKSISKDERGSKEGLKKAAKYASKGAGHTKSIYDDGWVTDQAGGSAIDPRLAVRWEFATYKMKLVQRYGALIGLPEEAPEPKPSEPQPHHDADVTCEGCGCTGHFSSAFRVRKSWYRECEKAGHEPLFREMKRKRDDRPLDSTGDPRIGTLSARLDALEEELRRQE